MSKTTTTTSSRKKRGMHEADMMLQDADEEPPTHVAREMADEDEDDQDLPDEEDMPVEDDLPDEVDEEQDVDDPMTTGLIKTAWEKNDDEDTELVKQVTQAWRVNENRVNVWRDTVELMKEQEEDEDELDDDEDEQDNADISPYNQQLIAQAQLHDKEDEEDNNNEAWFKHVVATNEEYIPLEHERSQTDDLNQQLLVSAFAAELPKQFLMAGRGELPGQVERHPDLDDDDDNDDQYKPPVPSLLVDDTTPDTPYISVNAEQRLQLDRQRLDDQKTKLARIRQLAMEKHELETKRLQLERLKKSLQVQQHLDKIAAMHASREKEEKQERAHNIAQYAEQQANEIQRLATMQEQVNQRVENMVSLQKSKEAQERKERLLEVKQVKR